jgi:predicted dienelactone hydrolase
MRGPHEVVTYDVDWLDAARNHRIRARIYAPAGPTSPAPVIVFSHGLGNSMLGYSYLGEHWASHGFLSVHPDHPNADEDVGRHGLIHLYLVGFDKQLRTDVPLDLRFVIDQLQRDEALPPALRGRIDRRRIGVAGHSLGAYAALALGGLRVPGRSFRDERVRAAVPMSMSENFPASAYATVSIPMLHFTGTRDSSILYGTLPYKRRIPFDATPREDQYLVTIARANHSTFSDDESAENRGAHDAIRYASTLFWNAYLRDEASARAALTDGTLARALDGVARLDTKGPQLRVGRVTVKTSAVFNEEQAKRGGFYRGANFLAVKTPERLLRDFLLFHEGEPFDEERVRESERNLRALDFLMSAKVTTSAPHDGVVDVLIETQDAWTTDVNADFSNNGGRSLYDVDVTQKDLFGTGSEVDVRTGNGRERRTTSIELLHPAVFGPYWNGDAFFAKSSDGNEERLAIARPLYSASVKQTFEASFDHLLQNARVYENGRVAALFRQEHREDALLGGTAVFRNARLLAGFDFVSDSFAPREGVAPDRRHFHFLETGIASTRFDWITVDHADLGVRQQDFDLGAGTSLIGGWSPGGVWRLRSDNSRGLRLSPRSFLLTHLNASTRGGNTNRNAIVSSDTRCLTRFDTALPQTLAIRLRADAGSRLDRDVQFFADGQNGLRAYPNFAFTGSRRILLNVEQRLFLGREVLDLFEPGAAVFIDTGRAGPGPLRTDAGAGLRFAISRMESTMLRFDIAYAFHRSPLSERGIVFSFATSQAF